MTAEQLQTALEAFITAKGVQYMSMLDPVAKAAGACDIIADAVQEATYVGTYTAADGVHPLTVGARMYARLVPSRS